MPDPGNLPNLTPPQAISKCMGLDSPQQAYISQMQGLRTALLDSMGAACQDSLNEGSGVNLQQRDECCSCSHRSAWR